MSCSGPILPGRGGILESRRFSAIGPVPVSPIGIPSTHFAPATKSSNDLASGSNPDTPKVSSRFFGVDCRKYCRCTPNNERPAREWSATSVALRAPSKHARWHSSRRRGGAFFGPRDLIDGAHQQRLPGAWIGYPILSPLLQPVGDRAATLGAEMTARREEGSTVGRLSRGRWCGRPWAAFCWPNSHIPKGASMLSLGSPIATSPGGQVLATTTPLAHSAVLRLLRCVTALGSSDNASTFPKVNS